MSKLNITITPYQALQICRWQEFIKTAVSDPNHRTEKHDVDGLLDAIEEISKQTKDKISLSQLDEAELEQKENKLKIGV